MDKLARHFFLCSSKVTLTMIWSAIFEKKLLTTLLACKLNMETLIEKDEQLTQIKLMIQNLICVIASTGIIHYIKNVIQNKHTSVLSSMFIIYQTLPVLPYSVIENPSPLPSRLTRAWPLRDLQTSLLISHKPSTHFTFPHTLSNTLCRWGCYLSLKRSSDFTIFIFLFLNFKSR